VLACPSIDGVIVGARTPEQFAELLTAPALPWSDELEQAIALAIGGELRCACS
jgi:aryl-alcohol dehydrogenase-like predicted oxidoreductase